MDMMDMRPKLDTVDNQNNTQITAKMEVFFESHEESISLWTLVNRGHGDNQVKSSIG